MPLKLSAGVSRKMGLEAFSKATSLKPDEPQPWEMLACTLANLGRLKEALEAFDRVKELGHECETCRQNRAILLSRLARADQAETAHQRLRALREESARTDPDDQQRQRTLMQGFLETAGSLAEASDRTGDAEEAYQEVLRIGQELTGARPTAENRQLLAAALFDLAVQYRTTSRVDAAEETYRRALRILEALSRREPDAAEHQGMVAACQNHLGILYQETGRLERAEAALEKARAVREPLALEQAENVENLIYLGGTFCNLGGVAGDRWQWQAALSCYDRSIRTLEAVLQEHGPVGLAEQFLANARDGRAKLLARMTPPATASRSRGWFSRWFGRRPAPPTPPQIQGAATIAPRPPGPEPHFPDPAVEFPAGAAGGLEALQAGRYDETLAALDRFLGDPSLKDQAREDFDWLSEDDLQGEIE